MTKLISNFLIDCKLIKMFLESMKSVFLIGCIFIELHHQRLMTNVLQPICFDQEYYYDKILMKHSISWPVKYPSFYNKRTTEIEMIGAVLRTWSTCLELERKKPFGKLLGTRFFLTKIQKNFVKKIQFFYAIYFFELVHERALGQNYSGQNLPNENR